MRKDGQKPIVVTHATKWQRLRERVEKNGCCRCPRSAFYMLNGLGYCEQHKPGSKRAKS